MVKERLNLKIDNPVSAKVLPSESYSSGLMSPLLMAAKPPK